MMVLWKLLSTVQMLLVVTVCMVTSQRPLGNTGRQIPNRLNVMIRIQQVKESILRRLNMTSPPQVSRSLPKVTSKTLRILETVDRQANLTTILSEQTDPNRQHVISFRFDPRLRAQAQNIETAVVIFFLHATNSSSSSGNTSRKTTSPHQVSSYDGTRERNRTGAAPRNKQGRKIQKQSSNNSIGRGMDVPKRRGHKLNHGSKRQQSGSTRKQRRVKIVLKVVDETLGRKEKIGDKQVIIQDSATTTAEIPIARDVVVAAASSVNQTLVLQVSCRRCQGRVQLEGVSDLSPGSNKPAERRPNNTRPYLQITFGGKRLGSDLGNFTTGGARTTHKETARKRFRKHASEIYSTNSNRNNHGHSSSNRNSNNHINNNININSNNHINSHVSSNSLPTRAPCSALKIFLTFEQLGLNHIIFPRGLSTVVCSGECSTSGDLTSRPHFESTRPNMTTIIVNGPAESHIRGADTRASCDHAVDSVNSSGMEGKQCHPATPRSLSIVYLDTANKATFINIDDVVHETCECCTGL